MKLIFQVSIKNIGLISFPFSLRAKKTLKKPPKQCDFSSFVSLCSDFSNTCYMLVLLRPSLLRRALWIRYSSTEPWASPLWFCAGWRTLGYGVRLSLWAYSRGAPGTRCQVTHTQERAFHSQLPSRWPASPGRPVLLSPATLSPRPCPHDPGGSTPHPGCAHEIKCCLL